MTFQTFIKEKQKEFIANGFKSAVYEDAKTCEISKDKIGVIYDFQDHTPSAETEVREVTEQDKTDEEVDGLDLCFKVVKARCKKPSYESVYIVLV